MSHSIKKSAGRRIFLYNAAVLSGGLLLSNYGNIFGRQSFNPVPGAHNNTGRDSKAIYCFGNVLPFPKSLYDKPAIDLLGFSLLQLDGFTLVNIECCLSNTSPLACENNCPLSAHLIFHYRNNSENVALHWLSGQFQPLLQNGSNMENQTQGIMFCQGRDAKEWLLPEAIPIDDTALTHAENSTTFHAQLSEIIYAGNLAIEGFRNLKPYQYYKFMPGHYLKLAWDSAKSEVTDNDDMHQFRAAVVKDISLDFKEN